MRRSKYRRGNVQTRGNPGASDPFGRQGRSNVLSESNRASSLSLARYLLLAGQAILLGNRSLAGGSAMSPGTGRSIIVKLDLDVRCKQVAKKTK